MNRNTLGRNFNGLVVFVVVIPVIVGVWMVALYGDALKASDWIFPGVAYVVFFGCMAALLYLVNLKEKSFVRQLEKVRMDAAHRAAELNALRDISEMTKDGLPVDDLLKLILDKAMQVVNVLNGSIFVVDSSEPEGLRMVDARPPVAFTGDEAGKPKRFSFVKSVIESGKAMRIQNIESDPRTLKANDPKYGAPSFISMPVYKNGQVMAVMNLANKENGGIFTESDERILTIMLAAIGTGIENISLNQQVRAQQTQIREMQARMH